MAETLILLISAERSTGDRLESILRGGDAAELDITRVETLLDGLRCLQERALDIIITDLKLPDSQGLATLRNLQQHAPTTPAIVVCPMSERETAIEAVRKGAYNFSATTTWTVPRCGSPLIPPSAGAVKKPKNVLPTAVQTPAFLVGWR